MHHHGHQALKKTAKLTGRDAVDMLPDIITVGAYDFEIVKMDALRAASEHAYGQFRAEEMLILIQQDMPTSINAADTFIHEVNHAVWWVYSLEEDDKEERIVTIMATAWTQIFRSNPWLAGWLGTVTNGKPS